MSKRLIGVLCFLAVLLLGDVARPVPMDAFAASAGRVYEMVSPVYKGGYGINGLRGVAPNGESVVFTSLGAFSGDPANVPLVNDYLGHRSASEWVTTPLAPPATLVPY